MYFPTALAVLFVWPSDYSMLQKTLLTVMVSVWANLGALFLNLLGILEPLTGLKLVTGKNRGFFLPGSIVTVAMQMDMPSDTEAMRQKILKHFLQYDLCRCRIVQISNDHFF